MATIRPADSTLFQGQSVEDYTCVLRVPGRVIATNRASYYVDDNDETTHFDGRRIRQRHGHFPDVFCPPRTTTTTTPLSVDQGRLHHLT